MNISKEDAIAHLAKWHDADATVRAVYTTGCGHLSMVGTIHELSQAAIKLRADGSEILIYFRTTSQFDYKDVRQTPSEANSGRTNQYPTVIDIKFSGGDHMVIAEHFSE